MVGYVSGGVILALFVWIPLSKSQLSLSVDEEQDAGTFVGHVDGANNDYTLTSTPYFELKNGNLFTTEVKIDRESLDNDIIQLTAVSGSSGQAPIEISVTVNDINDHDPIFPVTPLAVNLTEDSSTVQQLIEPLAEDNDIGKNAEIQYEIVSGSRGLFQLSLESTQEGSLLYLKVLQPLNREILDRYLLNISAVDGGTPPRRGYLRLFVYVFDINDNRPIFTQNQYKKRVPEDTDVGSVLLAVEANDKDLGQNGRVTYSIFSQPIPGTFGINATTGDIILEKYLDYETLHSHSLVITATDGGDPSMKRETDVRIDVDNVNDNDPEISFTYLPRDASVAYVDENVNVGDTFALVSVSDPDKRPTITKDVSMAIVAGNELGFFELNKLGPSLATIQVANNESLSAQSSYNITIRANDTDPEGGRYTLASMVILVNSGKNHPPQFDHKVYNMSISERSPIGSFVTSVHATDYDVGLNGRLAYSIEGGNEFKWFSIDRSTGLITIAKTLHFEQTEATNGSLILRIRAKDETSDPMSDNTEVRIVMFDENDNSPIFTEPAYSFNIAENTIGNAGKIEANDHDYAHNGEVVYNLESVKALANTGSHFMRDLGFYFAVDGNGYIQVIQALNREYSSLYLLRVSATDKGDEPRKSYVDVTINVTDTNDNAPSLYPTVYFATIAPSTSISTEITKIQARDLDSSDEGRITYHFVTNFKTRYYKLNPQTGKITLGQSLTTRNGAHDILTVYARDADGNVSNLNATISIAITSAHPTVRFENFEFEFYLLENSDDGFKIGKVQLASSDSARFYIVDGNEDFAFWIDINNGVIAVADSTLIDAEKSTLRNLTVVAEILDDVTSDTLDFISTTCLVHIVDVNDNFPTFHYLSSSAEQQGQNAFADMLQVELGAKSSRVKIYDVKADGKDVLSSTDILYYLSSSYPNVEIDSLTGAVYITPSVVTSLVDATYLQAEISACVSGFSKMCTTLSLNVTVTFLDRVFSQPMRNVYVEFPENSIVNTQITKVSYFEALSVPDIVTNVTYGIQPRAYFNIFPRGEVLLTESLNHEISAGHELALEMKIERDGYVWERTARLSVAVEDKNDNSPLVESNDFHLSVKENAAPGDFVGSVNATDADSGVYGSLVYTLQPDSKNDGPVSPSMLFFCDRFTGNIFVAHSPDRMLLSLLGMERGEIHLKMSITDQNGENSSISYAQITQVDVTIIIDFENRNNLAFETKTYYSKIRENTFSSDILQVSTYDKDSTWAGLPDVTYEIQGFPDTALEIPFVVGESSGIVQLKDGAVLDREKIDVHHLVLKAIYSDWSETAYANLFVRVLDLKDSPPLFTKRYFEFSVSEDLPTMSAIGRIEAVDGDEITERTRIRYEMTSDGESVFSIDPKSGFLFLIDSLDFETRQHYNVTVKATDESDQSSSVDVVVQVKDVNDNTPKLRAETRSIMEGFYSVPTRVATVRATDDDSGDSGRVRYSLLSSNPKSLSRSGSPTVRVDEVTGKVTVSGTVDRETAEELTIKVKAVDMDDDVSSRKSSVVTIHVKIKDANDNSPHFTSKSSYILAPKYASQSGHEIMKITATDSDQGNNGEVVISISENEVEANKFSINNDGFLVLRSTLNTDTRVHPVEIVARDKGTPRRQTTTTVYIILANEPISTEGKTFRALSAIALAETSQPGTYVTNLSKGIARTSNAQFYITKSTTNEGDDQNGMFSIARETGEISSAGDLTGKGGTTFVLDVVSVEESAGKGQGDIARKSVTIRVSDVNDNAPVFSSDTQRIAVSESVAPRRKVTTITATDADTGNEITYSLETKSGLQVTDFTINPKTGEIFVGESGLDREKQKEYELEVTASDGLHRSTTELLVDVEDVNDNPPQFVSTPICFDIRENSPPGTFVGRAEARDGDLNTSIEYTIADIDSDSMFRIHETYGTIIFEGSFTDLDRENQDLYFLQVRATDQGGLFSETTVFVYVTDANDHPPVFERIDEAISLSENTPKGSLLLTLTASDADLGLNAEIHYDVISGDENDEFHIHSMSGELRTVALLDREKRPSYNLTITATNVYAEGGREKRAYISVLIAVTDENDNAPTLINPYQTTSYLWEDAKIGSLVFHVNAVDPDAEQNRDVELSLVSQTPDHGAFRLNRNSRNIVISDNSNLDYESTTEYILIIIARDDGNPQLSSTTRFLVKVMDSNDNAPKFSESSYSISVLENTAVGTYLLTVQAEDLDSDNNGDVRYSILPSVDSSYVYINRFTGSIALANVLDHEAQKEMRFDVEARDGGVDPLRTLVSVVLTVEDENDCSPTITPTYSIIHVIENDFNPAKSLIKIFASDEDSGNNGVTDFRSGLEISPETDAFALTQSIHGSASLVLRKPLDREKSAEYEVTVTAVDQGSPPRKGTATFLIIVDDENDNIPEFDQNEYYAAISEDSSSGTIVATVKAVDKDGPDITYELGVESAVYPFYIHPSTGEVFTRIYLDREATQSYDLTVYAFDKEDSNGVQNRISVSLLVKVLDVNDNAPSFKSKNLEIAVDSSNSVGTIMIAEALDPDSGDNGRITYSITDNSSITSFTINTETGQIDATRPLISGHRLEVHAEDNGASPMSNTMDLYVFLTNARRPKMTHDIATPLQLLESERDKILGRFQATSARTGAEAIQFYLKGDRYNWFNIDQFTGQLKVTGNLDRELSSYVTLWIEARDSASPPLSAFEKIVINIDDENDNVPSFQNGVYTFYVAEDETKSVATIYALDPDQGENGRVSYEIMAELSESPEKFSIDTASGTLRNIVLLDREVKPRYRLVIRASDNGAPSRHRDIIIHVILDDVNDKPPEFTRLFSAAVKENADIGDFVLQITTTDEDEIFNHTYELIDNSNGHFAIDKQGVITVAKRLDRETVAIHTLEVQSRDDKWTTKTAVTIRIEDVNDNPPTFIVSNFAASASVKAEIGTVVLQLNASDADHGLNAKMHYRISGGNKFFHVNSLGQILTSRDLECIPSCPAEHSFTVVACDSGLPSSKCGFCSVTVSIKPVNNNPPLLDEMSARIALLKSTGPQTEVYSLSAADADPGSVLSYKITGGSGRSYFSISLPNVLVLDRYVDSFSPGQTLQLLVQVSDDGVPTKSAYLDLLFEITAENSHSPKFSESVYEAVLENATIGTTVVRLNAEDDDSGINGKVNYEIANGDDDGIFAIDKNTGVIRLTGKLDYEKSTEHEITVRAFDSGMVQRSNVVNVRIPVQDVNDNKPQFNASMFEIRIPESTRRGVVFTTFTVYDNDQGQNSVVQYSVDDVILVGIVPLTGEMYLNRLLDYETQKSHSVTIYAENEAPLERSEAEVFISVLGSNEFSPVFSESSYEFNIPHLAGKGTEVGSVHASDRDSGIDGIIEFLLTPSTDSVNFRLDKSSGDLTVSDGSSYSVGDVIYFDVVAKNPTTSSDSCLFDKVAVKISVISNECHKSPCKNNATCTDGPESVVCSCLPGYTGKFCGTDIDDCKSRPCVSGSCEDLVNGYRCLCKPGFTGRNCDIIIDHCEDLPCQNGGTCLNGPTEFTCECPFGAKGETCHIQSLNFPAQSFLQVAGFESDMTFEFSTVSTNVLLFYSDLTSSSHIILEIIDRKLRMSLKSDRDSEAVSAKIENAINDGLWHTVSITKDGRDFTLALEDCSSTEISECYTTTTLNQDINLASGDLTIGGVQNIDDLRTGLFSAHDFIGCMRSLTLDSDPVSSTTSFRILENNLVTDGCGKTISGTACAASVCHNGGTCNDLWTSPQCTCADGWEGQRCDKKMAGHTFTGEGFAAIVFTESFIRGAILDGGVSSTSRKKRSVRGSPSNIEIRFRTRKENAMLITAEDMESNYYASLYMEAGVLRYQHKTLSGLLNIQIDGDVSDGNWHTATVEITISSDVTAVVRVNLDESSEQKSFDRDSNVIDNFINPLIVKKIYVGGIEESSTSDLPMKDFFKGCVYHFKIDGVIYQLNPDVINYRITLSVEGSEISESCNGTGLTCDAVTCENGYSCVVDEATVSKCVCMDGYIESEGSCAMISKGGLDWWIIVIIAVLAVVFVSGALVFAICFKRRRDQEKSGPNAAKENGTANSAYEFQARIKPTAPDLVPDDVFMAPNNTDNEPGTSEEDSSNDLAVSVAIVPLKNGTGYNGSPPKYNDYSTPRKEEIISGRRSANDILQNESFSIAKRPASAQANLVPVFSSPVYDGVHVDHARTVPRKPQNRRSEYANDANRETPKRPGSRGSHKTRSSSRSSVEKKRQKRKSREAETLEFMMQELSGIAGLTREEMELLHAGALALNHDQGGLLYDDGSSVSTSSLTDLSIQSRTTASSLRVRSFVRSATPQNDIPPRDVIPGEVINKSQQSVFRPGSRGHSELADEQNNLGPFEFPPPPSESETDDPNSSSDTDTWNSATSDETAISTVKKVYSSDASSGASGSKTGKLDLNFPSNIEEYFASLVDVFDDIAQLNSDKSKISRQQTSEDPSRRPSTLPSFVSSEVSLWSEIEALSKRQIKKSNKRGGSFDTGSRSSPSGTESHGRLTPTRKTGNRMNSPMIRDVIQEEVTVRENTPPPRWQTPPVDDDVSNTNGRNTSRSSSGRSSKNSKKMTAEFVKFV